MRAWFIVAYLCAGCFLLSGNEFTKVTKETIEIKTNEPPQYLYKIVSVENWGSSQDKKTVVLSTEDDAFIHLATEDQVDRIIAKYWPDAKPVVVLKLDSSKLEGKLIYEANIGGTTKYYHLYQGFIPMNSIVESKINKPKL